MRVLSNGSTRRTASEWRQIFDRFRRSGLNARAFCTRESLVLASFTRWREKLENETSSEEFVDVTSSEQLPAFWAVEVELPDGCTLRLRR